jgi:hypothetical protein
MTHDTTSRRCTAQEPRTLGRALTGLIVCCTLLAVALLAVAPAVAQKKPSRSSKIAPTPASILTPAPTAVTEAECKTHLQFLASDRLLGRATGSAGCDTAAAYIVRHFTSFGLQPPSGMATHFQSVAFVRSTVPQSTTIRFGEGAESISVSTASVYVPFARPLDASLQAVYVGFGVVDSTKGRDDYATVDVRGKLVVTRFGLNDSSSLQQGAGWTRRKRDAAIARGAVGLVELLGGQAAFAWGMLGQFVNRPTMTARETFVRDTSGVAAVLLINDSDKKILGLMQSLSQNLAQQKRPLSLAITSSGSVLEAVSSQNVLAVLPGTDPQLRNEYILLSAHYDHLGTANRTGMQDTIYNGARDNGMGTTALLGAASVLAKKPLKRSVLFAAWTGEEMGLLGSKFYAEHPAIPHKNIVFNLNTDGAGFNDTTLVTVIGLDRTTAEDAFKQAASAQGLKAVADPAPEQNLFDRSDNVSFAAKGIPAPTFAPGFTAFDAAIGKYYHQVGDEAGDDFNFRYLTRYVNTFIDAARRIGETPERPRWKAGDKYEAAFQKLYDGK